jgi:hypothetical protein
MAKILIKVTQNDIDNGTRNSARTCPVSLALGRRIKGQSLVGVSGLYLPGSNGGISIPFKVADFVDRFDNKELVKPFNFYLDVPEHLIKK